MGEAGVKNRPHTRHQERILDCSRTLRPQPEILFSSHTDHQRTTLKKWSRNMKALRRKGANSQGEAGVKNRPHTRQQERMLGSSSSLRPRSAILILSHTDRQSIALQKWSSQNEIQNKNYLIQFTAQGLCSKNKRIEYEYI